MHNIYFQREIINFSGTTYAWEKFATLLRSFFEFIFLIRKVPIKFNVDRLCLVLRNFMYLHQAQVRIALNFIVVNLFRQDRSMYFNFA